MSDNKSTLAIEGPKPSKNRSKKNKTNNGAHKATKDDNSGKTMSGSTLALVFFTGLALSIVAYNKFAIPSNTFTPFGNESFPLEPVMGTNFWSSLISGHYFGLRNALPNSTIVSFMWFRNRVERGSLPILHWCDLHDRVNDYIWNYNDLRNFGHQTINDPYLSINTSFIRFGEQSVQAKLHFKAPQKSTDLYSVILYSAAESKDEKIAAEDLEHFEDRKEFVVNGENKINGQNYKIKFSIDKGQSLFRSFLTKKSRIHLLKETVLQNLYGFPNKQNPQQKFYSIVNRLDGDRIIEEDVNFIAYQVTFRKEMDVGIEITFDNVTDNSNKVDYESELQSKITKFNADFETKFNLKKQSDLTEEMVRFARAILSNTIGGISYFYGKSIVRDDSNMKVDLYGPMQLLTAVPSRTTFPRGFLWDEGFQQLLISAWDPKLSMTIIKNWFGLMNEDGWIPREVVLGDEAMARVPQEFLLQYSSNANPPSMLFAIEALIDSKTFEKEWLQGLYPRLERYFQWFNTSQAGHIPTTFRWRGRNATIQTELNPKTLTSGLDDAPRATNPTDDEYHIDLRCWMALASRVMGKISKILDHDTNVIYENFYETLRENKKLEQLHWNSEFNMFSDYGLHSRNVSLEKVPINHEEEVMIRVFHESPSYGFVPDMSYISLYPLMMQLLDANNPKISHMLDAIEDPGKFWTPFGLRSLSKDSFYYMKYNTEHDGPYWRGHIWINMNYLTLKALHHYSKVSGPFQERFVSIHKRLRKNIVDNMFKQYQKTGFVWEHYDDRSGLGKGTRPFTGWSALIVRIMGERY